MCENIDYIFKYVYRVVNLFIENIFVCKYLLIFIQVCIFVGELKTKISIYGNFI